MKSDRVENPVSNFRAGDDKPKPVPVDDPPEPSPEPLKSPPERRGKPQPTPPPEEEPHPNI